jgi:class 3 adenylate cyclase
MSAGGPPSGVVTFLFTDIEGSTRRWESDADAMRAALAAHDEVLRTAIEAHDGFLFSHTGDGVVAAFASRSTPPLRHSSLWSCQCVWDWRPAKPSCGTVTTSVQC